MYVKQSVSVLTKFPRRGGGNSVLFDIFFSPINLVEPLENLSNIQVQKKTSQGGSLLSPPAEKLPLKTVVWEHRVH